MKTEHIKAESTDIKLTNTETIDLKLTEQEIIQKDKDYILHSYGRVDVVLTKGKGATAWDVNGKKYIDFTSGIGVNSLGFSDPKWVQAISNQAAQIQHMSNYYYNPVNIELAEKLSKASGMSRSFFCESGAEANETAIKVARKFGEPRGANQIITLKESFHGRTLATLAATGQDSFHEHFLPLVEGFLYAEAGNLADVEAKISDRVCAVMIEMIQGEGGVIPMNSEFVLGLRKLCDDKNLLLIVDEVQTGVGRIGTFLGYQKYGVMPDVVTLAKGIANGLPIGVCMVEDKLKDVFEPGMNGSTFGGNPVVCAGALEVMRRVSDADFLAEVTQKGSYIREKLASLPEVELVRGEGLMLGIKLLGQSAKDVLLACAKQGLLVLTAKDLVRFLPPLVITYEEIDFGIEIFKAVLTGGIL